LPKPGVALVMIDMQRDFLEPGGFRAALGNDVSQLAPCVEPAKHSLEGFRRAGLPIVHTRERHRPDRADCPAAKRARGVTYLVVGGVTTEVCVQTKLREANDRGFECLLAADATASDFPAFKPAALEMIVAQGGILGWTAPVAAVLVALT
jgi:nicotinamidase-related amidase